jgi:hypothetical protein
MMLLRAVRSPAMQKDRLRPDCIAVQLCRIAIRVRTRPAKKMRQRSAAGMAWGESEQ